MGIRDTVWVREVSGLPDFEIVMKALECCSHPNGTLCVKCPYLHANDLPHNMPPCIGKLTRDVCALLKEQEPVVLTVNEVKRIGADNHGSFKNDGPTVMWLEEFGKQFPLHVVILKWDEDDWQGEPNDIVDVYYFGTDEYDHFSLTDYNKTWRCWTDKPTETQRMGAAWDADGA